MFITHHLEGRTILYKEKMYKNRQLWLWTVSEIQANSKIPI